MQGYTSNLKAFAVRLKPHDDLRKSIQEFAKEYKIKAGVILTCVGSLEQINIRFAHQEEGAEHIGFYEIIALSGTFSSTSSHIHIGVSDGAGQTFGGHLLDNNLVYTTAEIVMAELVDLEFNREIDPLYNYLELKIRERKEQEI